MALYKTFDEYVDTNGEKRIEEFRIKNENIAELYPEARACTDNYTDNIHKDLIEDILLNGALDYNPRPKYASDGKPAHTLSINHVTHKYDISKGQIPLITLRPIATKSSIGELLWIYQDASNDLDVLRDKYNITWWDEWAIKDENNNLLRSIGQVYGATVERYNLMHNLLDGIKKDPDGRRHIVSLWQEADFKEPHGLKPCAFMTIWNVRHAEGGDFLDMCLIQRSSDSMVALSINQTQYAVLLCLVARHLHYRPGVFTWFGANVQIYTRHIDAAKELYQRKSIKCEPYIWINPSKDDFYDMTIDDVKIMGYPMDTIKKHNPQVKLELGV